MKKSVWKRGISLVLALFLCLSTVIYAGTTTAFALGEETQVYLVSYPRSNDAQVNAGTAWGHGALHFMNGWSAPDVRRTTLFVAGSYGGEICYCIEPGTQINDGDAFSQKDESFWDNYPSAYNHTIDADTVKLFVGRILQYGYTGNVSGSWVSQDAAGADNIAKAYATQILIWETIVGERDENFSPVAPQGYDRVLDVVQDIHPLKDLIYSHYSDIEQRVQRHTTIPSFCGRSPAKANTFEMQWDGSQYTVTLTDTNGVLGDYSFSSDRADLRFSVSGNQLTMTSSSAPTEPICITAVKKNMPQRKGLIVWSDGIYEPGVGQQDLVSYTQSVNDPVQGFVNLKVSFGAAKIIKTSEDGKVDGISFRIQGEGIDQMVATQNGGQIQVDHLRPGVYTVTEQTTDPYEPQETRRVTVVSGQTSTVTFNNVLKRGDLEVVKTSEDHFVQGVKFHLYGTSLSGLPVDEYAVTDENGVARFENVLISGDTPYTVEEVDTAVRYVVPESQTAPIEWEKVTSRSFTNILKKFNVTVTKSDAETGTAQGDASLAGAVYGIYKGEELIDTYTTDENGQFTTDDYICDDDWTIREISPSEGYLLDTTIHHIGAEPELYTVERNSTANDVTEQIIKGNIALIKHTDDGSTQIETPETGATFEVYLKAAGSYDAAKETEREILICDENGFAQTKDMPYGVYVVKQTSGWEGRELMKPFEVFISEDGQTYRYLINNANFESYIKIVKKDAETGNTIPYAGAGFQIYDPNGELVTMTFTYPEVTTIDTFYTTADGYLITPQTLEYGTGYSIVEVQAPYGYVLNSEPVYFDVTQDGSGEESGITVIEVVRSNMAQKGTITVSKSGEVFTSVSENNGMYQPVYGTQGLAGAVYEVRAAEDIITLDGTLRYAKGSVVAEITTGADGTAVTEPLYLGKFEVREIKAPYGMVISNEVHAVELTYAGQEIEITETETDFYNERQKAAIHLRKMMEQDARFGIGQENEILSVQFGLFAAEDLTAADGAVIPADSLLEIVSCDENGNAAFQTDIPTGAKLYVQELATDERYILSEEKYPVVFDYAGQDTALVEIKVHDGDVICNEILYGTVKGFKIDRETETGIAGALFGLFRSEETAFTEETALLTAESMEDGVFTFEGVPYGNWIVRELRPAEGFLMNDALYSVTVTEKAEVIEITAVNDRIPEIKTQASVEGEKEVYATEVFTLTDTVSYQHLIPGREYVLKGVLMDKSTGEPLRIDGQEVRTETVFIPQSPFGDVIAAFTFDSKWIQEDTDIVVFEALYSDGQQLAVHADLADAGQTVRIRVPRITTQAAVDGKKEITADGSVTITDVITYENLTPGKIYTVQGILMNHATGQPLLIDETEIRNAYSFRPDTSNGEISVTFTFDASALTEITEIVVFETLLRDETVIAEHADMEDINQTVRMIPPMPDNPQTGDSGNMGFWIGLGAVAVGGLVAMCIIHYRKKKDEDE